MKENLHLLTHSLNVYSGQSGQVEARSLGLPHECRGHPPPLSQAHRWGAGSEVQQQQLEWALIWDARITCSGLT